MKIDEGAYLPAYAPFIISRDIYVNRDTLIIADNEEIKHRVKTSKICVAKMLRTSKLSMSRLRNRVILFPSTITHYAKSLTPISLYDDNIITFRIESSRESECSRYHHYKFQNY